MPIVMEVESEVGFGRGEIVARHNVMHYHHLTLGFLRFQNAAAMTVLLLINGAEDLVSSFHAMAQFIIQTPRLILIHVHAAEEHGQLKSINVAAMMAV